MALLIKPNDLQGVPTTLIKSWNFLKKFNPPPTAPKVASLILLYENNRIPCRNFRVVGGGVYRGRIFATCFWTILTPWRSIGLMSKVIQGQGQILGHLTRHVLVFADSSTKLSAIELGCYVYKLGLGQPSPILEAISLNLNALFVYLRLHPHVLNVLGMQMRSHLHMQISHVPYTTCTDL